MNRYLVCFRLNLPLFALSNLMSLYLYYKSDSLLFTLALKLIAFPVLAFLFNPLVERYNYFFHNQGWTLFRIYLIVAAMDILIFMAAIVVRSYA